MLMTYSIRSYFFCAGKTVLVTVLAEFLIYYFLELQ